MQFGILYISGPTYVKNLISRPRLLLLDEPSLELAQHGYVLETDTIALDGKAKSLMDNDHVRKAYLGI
jgi:ABC-type branched-subunit amino acid transport system ATPase component